MTDRIKAAARARQAETGEPYSVARRKVIAEHAARQAAEVVVTVPAGAVVTEFPEPVSITNPDGSVWSLHGSAVWDAGSEDSCEGAP